MAVLLIVLCILKICCGSWVDTYNTIWDSPGIDQWGSVPIGNGDLTGNVWLQQPVVNLNDAPPPNQIYLLDCLNSSDSNYSTQLWQYDITIKLLENQNQCLLGNNAIPLETTICDANNISLYWTFNNVSELVNKHGCLDVGGYFGEPPNINLYKCFGGTPEQWIFNNNSKTAQQIRSVKYPNKCITAVSTVSEWDIYFSFGKSDSYDITGERLKMIQMKLSLNPPITNFNSFTEILNVSNAIFMVKTDNYTIQAYIDANSDRLNIEIDAADNIKNSYSVKASLITWRTKENFNPGGATGDSFCNHPNIVPIIADIILNYDICDNSTNFVQSFYHRNNYNGSNITQFTYQMKQQYLESLMYDGTVSDPYLNVTWGGILNYKNKSLITFDVLTSQTQSLEEWNKMICSDIQNKNTINYVDSKLKHQEWWNTFWNHSYLEIFANNNTNQSVTLVSKLYNLQRYLDALDGRSKNSKAIKFNGQSFWIDTGSGPDYKQWGSGYWWQNTRETYYNTMVTKDNILFNEAMYQQYYKQLPLILGRNKLWFNHSGGFFAETAMFNGLHQEGTYGYLCNNRNTSTNYPYPNDFVITWIRYYWNSGLELIHLLLDDYKWNLNDTIINYYLLPISDALLNHYDQHFPINSTNGKMNIYPSAALETWQCPDIPPNKTNCVTNPVEQIAALGVITERLLNLPNKFGTNDQRSLWKRIYNKLPDFPMMKAKDNTTIIAPAEILPPNNMNHENVELYTVHPYRVYQFFKPELDLAINTYKNRRFPCNDGWCQDILDASMLGLVGDAEKMVIQRAQAAKGGLQWKFDGFTGHFQDYEPSSDHLSFMRTGIHYMLITNNFDNNTIYLLPTWPCQWSVKFKLYATNNTMVELDYDGDKKVVNNLLVVPQERQKDVIFVNCITVS